MEEYLSKLLDELSEYFANRKGFLPLIGAGLVLINLVLAIIFPGAWITRVDLFMHLGVIVAIIGLVLARAL